MGRKAKGTGSFTNNSLTLQPRFALMKWCEAHKDDHGTYAIMAADASADLGFVVTENVMQSHWVAVNGPRYRKDEKISANKMQDIADRLAAVERKLDRLALFVGGSVKV